jgi:hypothetical protein
MEYQHYQTTNDDEELVANRENSNEDDIEEDNYELSKTPIPESINDEDENIEFSELQVDENVPQQQSSSSIAVPTPDDNGSLSATTTAITTATIKTDDRASPLNHHTLRENQQISDRSSPVNGPGLAKPLSMTSSLKEQQRLSSSSTTNPVGKKRVDAALEKNIETIVTQVRRTTTKPSQLTQNDLQLFDSTPATNQIKNGHHSRETTPITSNTNNKYVSSSSSREMTPDSINTDSANEDQQQQQTIRNGHHYPHSSPSTTVDLTASSNSLYGQQQQQPWPPTVYPFAHQHPGLYLPYPPSAPLATTSTPTNGLPPFYPSYDPLLIEQHYGPHGYLLFIINNNNNKLVFYTNIQ